MKKFVLILLLVVAVIAIGAYTRAKRTTPKIITNLEQSIPAAPTES